MRSRQERKSCQGKMVDDAHKEKSRYCAREFATFKDPSAFAAASDVDNTSLIDLLAVKILMQWLHLVKLLRQSSFSSKLQRSTEQLWDSTCCGNV